MYDTSGIAPTITRADCVADLAGDEHEAQITARGPDGRERDAYLTVEARGTRCGVLVVRDRDGVTVHCLDLSLLEGGR